jgi:hypothetical protein
MIKSGFECVILVTKEVVQCRCEKDSKLLTPLMAIFQNLHMYSGPHTQDNLLEKRKTFLPLYKNLHTQPLFVWLMNSF